MAGTNELARAASSVEFLDADGKKFTLKVEPEHVSAVFAAITNTTGQGERVQIKDFGSFTRKMRAARTITSPKLPGGTADVPARLVMTFKASPKSREDVDVADKVKQKAAVKATSAAPAVKPTKPVTTAKPAAAPGAGKEGKKVGRPKGKSKAADEADVPANTGDDDTDMEAASAE